MIDSLSNLWSRFANWWREGPRVSSPAASDYSDLANFLGHTIRNTPKNLDAAFAMRKQLNSPDTMTGISNTAVTGAHGATSVVKRLQSLAGNNPNGGSESDK